MKKLMILLSVLFMCACGKDDNPSKTSSAGISSSNKICITQSQVVSTGDKQESANQSTDNKVSSEDKQSSSNVVSSSSDKISSENKQSSSSVVSSTTSSSNQETSSSQQSSSSEQSSSSSQSSSNGENIQQSGVLSGGGFGGLH